MSGLRERLAAFDVPRLHVAVLIIGVCLAVGLQSRLSWWTVEDAAISFAYARNAADGWGLTPMPGGERVEGYSNPLWVALLTLWASIGVHGFWASWWLAIACTCITVPLVWQLAASTRPALDGTSLVAVGAIASSALLAIWSASGLENPLFICLLTAGAVLTLREGRDGGLPFSALAWLGVALTRPEGVLYAAVGGALLLTFHALEKRGRRVVLAWIATFTVPFLLYHAVRYAYFALPFPATYYAKLAELAFDPFDWNNRSWKYVLRWGRDLGAPWILPVCFVGLVGTRGRPALIGLGALAAAAGVLLVEGNSAVWIQFRVAVLFLVAVGLPLAALERPRWRAVVLCWMLVVCSLIFAVRVGGDWMRGHRFLSLSVTPLAVLFAAGVGELADRVAARVPRRGAWAVVAVALLVTWVWPNFTTLSSYRPVTTPADVKLRLDHYRRIFDRLQLDRPFLAIDHDMGGMLWYATPSDGRIIDARGLVDVPFALHQRRARFVDEYIFDQQTFDLCHAHASTGQAVRQLPRFKEMYVETPPYRQGSGFHRGNFVRRDLFLRMDWAGTSRPVSFEGDVRIEGFELPSPEVGPGSGLFVEVAVVPGDKAFRLLAFIAGPEGALQVWDVPPAYDWVPSPEWNKDERFVGRFSFPVNDDLPLGDYDLGFVALSNEGDVLAAYKVPPGATLDDPRVAEGEARFPGRVEIVSRNEMARLAAEDRSAAIAAARSDRCEEAERSWERALRHRTRSGNWQRTNRPAAARAIASCWAKRAEGSGANSGALADLLSHARTWDPTAPQTWRIGAEVAEKAYRRGLRAREGQDHATAFRLFDAAVRADPTHAWARRYAEEARAYRLGWISGTADPDMLPADRDR